MKFEIRERRLYVYEATSMELGWLSEKLTFKVKDNKGEISFEKLLFQDDNGGYFTFIGLFQPLSDLSPSKYKLEIINPRKIVIGNVQVPPDIIQGKRLFDFQCGAIKKAVILKEGILKLPTGAGKSIIAVGYMRYLFDNNLVTSGLMVVPSVVLAEQFRTRALECGFKDEDIGLFHGKLKQTGRKITIGVSDSLYQGIEKENEVVISIFKSAGFITLDEVHHVKSMTWVKILNYCNAEYRIGLSATPFKNDDIFKDIGDATVQGVMGSPIFEISHEYLRNVKLSDGTVGLIAKPIIHFIKVGGRMAKYKGNYAKIYSTFIVKDRNRNDKIIKQIRQFQRFELPTLVLIQRKEHATILMNLLGDHDCITVFGDKKGIVFDEQKFLVDVTIDYEKVSEDFTSGKYRTIFASQVMDEGVDIAGIGALIMAGGGRSRIAQLQRIGRSLRAKRVGLNESYIVDFADRGHVFLAAQTKRRRELYKEIDAEIVEDGNIFWQFMKKNYDLVKGIT